ncbi:MAG TPA: glycosyltransferase family 39 protein [Candidatus Enterenecus merdae]|nr:glycosyltransferase family 39 protein [Candidatus Enterenecus merdae]
MNLSTLPLTGLALSASPSAAQGNGSVWDSISYGLSWFFQNLAPAAIWVPVGLAVCLAFFIYYWYCLKPRPYTLEWIAMAEARTRSRRMTLTLRRHPFQRKDVLPMLVITLAYAATAFFRLGDLNVPQSYTVFQGGTSFTFSFSQPVQVDKLSYYTSLGSGSYLLEYSADGGQSWQRLTLEQPYDALLKWEVVDLVQPTQEGEQATGVITADTWRISAGSVQRYEGLWLAELALWREGEALVPQYVSDGGQALFDESDVWADKATYLNSSYFDEIYHPRTALEHLNNIYPYEVSHPPLGKLIIAAGISLFGMTPFGWRFMGTLFGVLMLPILYAFLKNLFGKTPVAVCGTCLFAFDFMHLVQTRISTIDTYGVFFILLSYYFLYRWLTVPPGSKLRRSVPSLFLSGLSWGVGCACKWTVVYAGVGLALLWLLGLLFKRREWRRLALVDSESALPIARPRFGPYAVGTVILSAIFFVLIPICIYVATYLPYVFAAAARDGTQPSLQNLLSIVWDNQVFMLTYHQGVHTPHPYESYWYQWILDARPILYYRDLDYAGTLGVKSLFASFNNPLVSWGGLLAFFGVLIQTIRRKSGRGLFLLIAILSQFVPWLFIGRILFAYHYFPTVLFLVFAIAYLMNDMLTRRRGGCRVAVYGFTGCAVGLYALFYPALTGLYMPLWYSQAFLRWLPSWPL